MDFKQLEAFKAVIEKGSYSEAAKCLYLSQPTVSLRMRSLQEELQVTLLRNNGRSVELTHAGSIFLRYAESMLQMKTEALEAMRATQGVVYNRLHISTTSIGTYILPRLAADFQAAHPSIQLAFSFSNTHSAIRSLLDKETDLVLSPAVIQDESLSSHIVGHDKLVLATGKDHPLAAYDGTVPIGLLQKYHFIIREEGSDTRSHFVKWCEEAGFKPDHLVVMDRSEAILIALQNQLGISILSQSIIENDSRFKVIPVEGLPIFRPIQVFMLSDQKDDPLKLAFISYVRERLRMISSFADQD